MGKESLTGIKAIGFDLDGTLYKSSLEMSKWLGGQLIDRVVEHVRGEREKIEIDYNIRREELGSNTKTLDSFGLDGMDVFQQLWNELPLEQFVQRNESVIDGLLRLKERYQMFLISNGRGVEVEKKLAYLGIEPGWFVAYIACYDHGWVKPDPAPFLEVLQELELKPEEMLYVGDREATDIEGARGVGMKTCMVYGESELADISCRTIEDFFELV